MRFLRPLYLNYSLLDHILDGPVFRTAMKVRFVCVCVDTMDAEISHLVGESALVVQ